MGQNRPILIYILIKLLKDIIALFFSKIDLFTFFMTIIGLKIGLKIMTL